jgi:sulfotransferase family protein
MNPHITWLASYPKSGNTWVRFIVFFLEHGRLPASSPELDLFASSRLPAYVREAPEFCSSLGPRPFDSDIDGQLYCKTHASAGALEPLKARTRRAIYIHRHPLDVLQSALNYARLTGELAPDAGADAWIESYIEKGGNSIWFAPYYAAMSWRQNVREWKACDSFPVLWLSYERSLIQPRETAIRIADFLAIPADEERIDACVAATSFSNLKAFEDREIERALNEGAPQGRFSTSTRLAAATRGARFFNRGKRGAYKDTLTPDQIARAWRMFEPECEALGYTRDQ